MNTVNKILNNKLSIATIVACVIALPAIAATSNGCDSESNDRINPEIALCSTHVYNIGGTQNPSSESDKQFMRDAVALKTTVMTQQMYKQYEYLETMMRRFKTQLEKAVLTTKLAAAGADVSSGTSLGNGVSTNNTVGATLRSGSNKYVVLSGAKNCSLESSTITDGLQCLLENMNKILTAVDNGDIGGAKRQLDADIEVAKGFGITNKPSGCNSVSNNASSVSNCAYALRIALMSEIEKKQNQNRQNNQNPK